MHSYMLWATQLERKRMWGYWWMPGLNVSQQWVLAAKGENGILGCIRHSISRWVRQVIIPPLIQHK